MDIAALVLWMFTAGAGLYLLRATIEARRARMAHLPPAGAEAAAAVGVAAPAAAPVTPAVPAGAVTPAPPGGTGLGGTGLGGPPARTLVPPPIPRVRVVAGPDDHPLLEFSHPALAVAGCACWLGYVATRYPTFAWIAFAALLVTIVAGLSWLAAGARSRRRREHGEHHPPGVSPHLVVLHGVAAGTTLVLAVLTMLTLVKVL